MELRRAASCLTVSVIFVAVVVSASSVEKKSTKDNTLTELALDTDEHVPFVDYAVRLRGCDDTISVQAGRLEIYYKDEWGTVCNQNFSDIDAHVACYSLGFTRFKGISLLGSFGPGSGQIQVTGLNCNGSEIALNQCRHPDWLETSTCSHDNDVSLACIDDTGTITTGYRTRLVNTVTNNTLAGRLEIYHDECWGTVCDDDFDEIDARIACRSINPRYRQGRIVEPSELDFGPGEGRIWLDGVQCNVRDINIGYCAHRPWGVHDCHHEEDIAIECKYTGCDLDVCLNGATCLDHPTDIDGYICECVEGYFGPVCESTRCMNISCLNGGTCFITGDICQCRPFYTGVFCETEIGGCESAPCLHGATCHENRTEHTCQCNQHYTGSQCETVIGGCESSPCLNNATCIQDGYNFTCLCQPEFSGLQCERPLKGCEIERCFNGATCHENGTVYTCECAPYYTGAACETEIGGCDVPPCVNNGTCVENGRFFTCLCPPFWTGTYCEDLIGGCDVNNCLNGGTCIENGIDFTCRCDTFFTGTLCESEIGGCEVPPCLNGGTCIQQGRNFTCQCPPAYGGHLCEAVPGGCEINRCENGATCEEQGEFFTCICHPSYYGQFCENAKPPSPCGDILHFKNITNLPGIPDPVPGQFGAWSVMCYLGDSAEDRKYWNLPCIQTVVNTYLRDGLDILTDGHGDNTTFGCFFTEKIPYDEVMYQACKREFQVEYPMTSNSTNVMMAVCLKYVPWPWPGSERHSWRP